MRVFLKTKVIPFKIVCYLEMGFVLSTWCAILNAYAYALPSKLLCGKMKLLNGCYAWPNGLGTLPFF